MNGFDRTHKYCVNAKNGRVHCTGRAKPNCYRQMDRASPRYVDDLEDAFFATDSRVEACKVCMKEDIARLNKIKAEFYGIENLKIEKGV